MNRPHLIQDRMERMIGAALDEPLLDDQRTAGRLDWLFRRIDDNLVEI